MCDLVQTFSMNLSAPFIAQFFKSQVDEIMPFVDILIGNESEAEAYADSHDFGVSTCRIESTIVADPLPRQTKDIAEIAIRLAASPKTTSTPRIVIITQGASSTIVASASSSAAPTTKVYPVTALPESAIVDTNGAGDAFAGGFIGAYVQGKTVDESVEVGHRMGQMCVGQVGPQFLFPKVNVL